MEDCPISRSSARRRRRPARLALAGLAGLATLATGLVMTSLWIETDAREALDEAFDRPLASARADARLTVHLDRFDREGQRTRWWASGPVRRLGGGRPPEVDWRIGGDGSLGARQLRLMNAGGRTVLTLDAQPYEVPPALVDRLASELRRGLEPRAWFQNVERRGGGRADGVPTERLVAELRVDRLLQDVDHLLDSLPISAAPPITAEQRRGLALALRGSRATIEVAEADRALRRIDAAGRLSIPVSRRAQAGGVVGGGFSFSLRLNEVDRPRSIAAPRSARPFAELLRRRLAPAGWP